MASGHEGSQIEDGADGGPAAPHDTFATPAAALSRLSGATPTSAAICRRSNVPCSVRLASRVVATTGPTPGVVCSSSSFCRQIGLDWIARAKCAFRAIWRSSQAMWAWMSPSMRRVARPSRFRSAVSISATCRRRASRAGSFCGLASGMGRTAGRTASANCANTGASRASVFANRLVA